MKVGATFFSIDNQLTALKLSEIKPAIDQNLKICHLYLYYFWQTWQIRISYYLRTIHTFGFVDLNLKV